MKVVIFRHQMFKISEPFIVQQAENLKNYTPVYVGRDRFGQPPPNSLSLASSDVGGNSLAHKIWQVSSRSPKKYLRLLEEEKPNLIHAHFGVEGVYALPLAKKLNVPLITTFHGFDATTKLSSLLLSGSPSWINYALLRKKLARKGDMFLCVSEHIRNKVIDLGFPEDKTHVHHIGIDVDNIEKHDISNHEKPVVLHVARLVEKKGTEFLIRAFALIAKQYPDFTLEVMGDGPLKENLENVISELGIKDRVFLRGATPHQQVMEVMSKSAVVVAPSVTSSNGDTEGLPMVILEAAAMGLPVIGTYHSGIPEAVINESTGYLVKEKDIKSLASALSELLGCRAKRYSMGQKGRQWIEEKFNIKKQSSKLEDFYMEVCHER